MILHRLAVDGKDYFLPEPVDQLKADILAAVRAGGGYVNIPSLRSGRGPDILFSPGMPVTWAVIEVRDDDHNDSGDKDDRGHNGHDEYDL